MYVVPASIYRTLLLKNWPLGTASEDISEIRYYVYCLCTKSL